MGHQRGLSPRTHLRGTFVLLWIAERLQLVASHLIVCI